MDRISSLGSHSMTLAQMMRAQTRLQDLQEQMSTGKRSQNYTGISKDSNRLINMEVELNQAKTFIDRNGVVDTQLKAMNSSIQSADKTVRDFIKKLAEFKTNDTKDATTVDIIQQNAFQAMLDLQSQLNISVDGQYLFAGGKVSTAPVDYGSSTLSAFQASYDGMKITYPYQRDADMMNVKLTSAETGGIRFAADGTVTSVTANAFSTLKKGGTITISGSASNNKTFTIVDKTNDSTIKLSRLVTETATSATLTFKGIGGGGTDLVVDHATAGDLTITPGADTIAATLTPNVFNSIAVGTVFTVSGSGSNDGTYQIASNDGTTITIESVKVTAEGVAPAAASTATITASSWYKGDDLIQQRRVDTDRTVDTGILASNPVFEKAIRAMGLIAQGSFGTAGGLESNLGRVDQALYLLQDAVDSPTNLTKPTGWANESRGDTSSLEQTLAWNRNVIAQKNEKHKLFSAFLEAKASDIENVDRSEVGTMLLDQSDALQASYATLAKVRNLSLLNYMT